MDLMHRTVLITGASSGIGAATARLACERGATVALVARREDVLAEVAAALPGRSGVFACDVGDADAVAAMAGRVRAELGTPDVIVNNAGAGRWLFIEETDPQEFLQMVAVPFHAAFFVTRAFVPQMLRRGSGWVVNVNSPMSEAAWPGALGYGCSRWGLRGFDECLAADLRGTGIGVTSVVASRVTSQYFEHNPGALDRMPSIETLLRTLSPDDVAAMICRGVEQERRRVIEPVEVRAMLAVCRWAPSFSSWLAGKTGARRSVPSSAA